MQEAHSTLTTESQWKRVWVGDILFNHGASNSTGVVVLIKHTANIKITKKVEIILGRVTLLEVEYESIKHCLINVYSPNNDDVKFLKKSNSCHPGTRYVSSAGDWNTVLNNALVKKSWAVTHANHKSQNFLNSMINDYGFSDVF